MTDAEVVALLQEIRDVARESLESKWRNQFGEIKEATALVVWADVDLFCALTIKKLEQK